MEYPRVFADFHNADSAGRIRLNCTGTMRDLSRQGIALGAGVHLKLYSEDLETEGVVEFGDQEKLWVAGVGWKAINSTLHEMNGSSPSR